MPESDWRVERLERSHDRSAFRCGKGPLDVFLHRLVSQYEKRNLGRTCVLVRPGDTRIFGYYTLASGSVSFEVIPPLPARRLPKHPLPVILLARLAVDQAVQGRRLGERLLIDALRRSASLAGELGVHAVEVHAIDEKAREFYRRYGFVPLADRDLHLYLPVSTILRLWE